MTNKPELQCDICSIHGFPCIPCADIVFHGELGPGFLNHKRLLTSKTCKLILFRMMNWINNYPCENVYMDSDFRKKYLMDDNLIESTKTCLVNDPRKICIS